MIFIGKVVGGPADGQIIEADTETVLVPIRTGPNRGLGDRGFGAVKYRFDDGVWKVENAQ